MSRPVSSTVAEAYLRGRGITVLHGTEGLALPPALLPSLGPILSGRDLAGIDRRRHRTRRLDHRRAPHLARPAGSAKAPIDTPRRATGHLLCHGVRFGVANDTIAAGDGIESILSLRMPLPGMPMLAALGHHLVAILFQPALRRVYIGRDRDAAGDTATRTLVDRAHLAGIDAIALTPRFSDSNVDLRRLGLDPVRTALRLMLARRTLSASCPERGHERNEASTAPKVGHRIGRPVMHPCRSGRARLREGDRTVGRPGRLWRSFCFLPLPPPPRTRVPRTPDHRHSSRKKKAGPPSPALIRPLSLRSAVPARLARPLVIA